MDGAVQTVYPRKNWSSLMLFNCDHPSVRSLTPEVANSQTGAYLHRMQWVADEDIGALPVEWNWLEGWNEKPAHGTPKAVHFTRGGPWFASWQNVEYGDLWLAERDAFAWPYDVERGPLTSLRNVRKLDCVRKTGHHLLSALSAIAIIPS